MALTDNPMSLVVTGNVTVGATLEASVPTTETRLLSTMDVNTTVTITVPAGVKVLKVEGDVYHEHEGEVALDVYSVNSKKYWLSVYNYEYASDIWHVGVTPPVQYQVVDDTKLGTMDAFQEYAAGTATQAALIAMVTFIYHRA